MHEELVDRQLLGEPLEHADGRRADGFQDVGHQFRLLVIGHAGGFFAHQLAGDVPAAGQPPYHQHALLLQLVGRVDGLPVDSLRPELKQRPKMLPVVHAFDGKIERQGHGGHRLAQLHRPPQGIALDERLVVLIERPRRVAAEEARLAPAFNVRDVVPVEGAHVQFAGRRPLALPLRVQPHQRAEKL